LNSKAPTDALTVPASRPADAGPAEAQLHTQIMPADASTVLVGHPQLQPQIAPADTSTVPSSRPADVGSEQPQPHAEIMPADASMVQSSPPADSGRAERSQPHPQIAPADEQEVPKDALPRSFSFDRPRPRRKPLDPQAKKRLAACRKQMAEILKRKKVKKTKVRRTAVKRTLEIAAYHQLERSRRDRYLENQAEAIQGLERIPRSGPPAVVELWELMPAQTRSAALLMQA
jgi:hypothetical protein